MWWRNVAAITSRGRAFIDEVYPGKHISDADRKPAIIKYRCSKTPYKTLPEYNGNVKKTYHSLSLFDSRFFAQSNFYLFRSALFYIEVK